MIEKYQFIYKGNCDRKDIEDIEDLEDFVGESESISFKFELSVKFVLSQLVEQIDHEDINEFLVYDHDLLIGYLGIVYFNQGEPEISAIIHPNYRNKGIFTKLLNDADKELKRRGFDQYLLLCDCYSKHGMRWIGSRNLEEDHIEYEMIRETKLKLSPLEHDLKLILAKNKDLDTLLRLDQTEKADTKPYHPDNYPKAARKRRFFMYLVKHKEKTIGKITIEYHRRKAWIFGFVMDPINQEQHFGEDALKLAIKKLRRRFVKYTYLQVDSINNKAVNLYRKIGFTDIYSMVYYKRKIS